MGNVHMEATQINYRGGASKMNVEDAIKSAIELTPEQKTNINKIPTIEAAVATKTDQTVIAPEFDSESGIYAIGDLVMHEGKLYEFTSAHETAGDWNSEEVTEKTVADEVDSLKSGLTNLISHGFVTVSEGFYCEDAYKAKYTIISNGTHGIATVNGYIKNRDALTGGSPYSICTVPTTSARLAKGIVDDSIGDVYIEGNSDIIKFVPSSNLAQLQNIQFTLSFMF